MLQDTNVERYVENAIKPLKKEIAKLKVQIEELNKALQQTDVSGSFCQCKKPNYSYTVPVCNKCNCVVDFSAKLPLTTKLANKHINNNEQRKYKTIIPR